MFSFTRLAHATASSPYNTPGWTVVKNTNNVYSRVGVDANVVFLGKFTSDEGCAAAATTSDASFQRWTFHETNFVDPAFAGHCYGDKSMTWTGEKQGHVDSAYPADQPPPTPGPAPAPAAGCASDDDCR